MLQIITLSKKIPIKIENKTFAKNLHRKHNFLWKKKIITRTRIKKSNYKQY